MSFFSNLLNLIRGINKKNKPVQMFTFGSIISGSYSNWKTDPHPTILCLGNYNKNGKWYVHGIQLHLAGASLNFIINTIINIKKQGVVTNPLLFYNYLKINNPNLVKNCYRTYLSDMCDFKTISPGFSNINEKYCYPISDNRDNFITRIVDNKKNIQNIDINSEQLRNNITQVINSVKVW